MTSGNVHIHVGATVNRTATHPMEPQKRLFRKYVVLSCLITALLILLVAFSYRMKFLDRADLYLYDLHFLWRGPQPTSGNTVLVMMDQKSATALERRKGAWSRAHVAGAVRNLCRSGASVIGLDMVFFAPSQNPEEDDALASALEECGNVVLAKFVAEEGRAEISAIPRFQDVMLGDGFINMFPDLDGVVRRVPFLSVKPAGEGVAVAPSFPLEVVRAFLNLDFVLDFSHKEFFRLGGEDAQKLVLPYPDLRIHYYGGSRAFSRLSFSDVVQDRFRPETVKGKVVLVGSSLATDKDFFATPFSRAEGKAGRYRQKFGRVVDEDSAAKTVGVAVHAMAVETMLNRAFIDKAPAAWVVSLTILFGILGLLFYLQRPGPLIGLLVLLGLSGLLLAGAHLGFVRRLVWMEISPPLAILCLQYVSGIAVQRAYGRGKTKLVTSLFGKYVSRGVVTDILKGNIGVTLEGASREVTVLFSDLRGFTTISEGLAPQETGRLLNTYFDAMIPIVFELEGTLDKLMGDAIMAFFGAPGDVKDHPCKAAETALRMTRRLEELKQGRPQKGIEKLAVGIGLNTGLVTVGNLGSQHFMDYTVIGDAVNLGSRLEGLNKTYGTSILMSEFTARRLDSRFLKRELDRVRVKGKGDAVGIFELAGFHEEPVEERAGWLRLFETGIEQYRNREWDRAKLTFQEVLSLNPQDGPSALYLERVTALLDDPPGPEWEPITTFTTK
ncbi:MAG: adenylate/guanylate cyclase domain-containing protein [Thermodesulfobacteriota bacterium]